MNSKEVKQLKSQVYLALRQTELNKYRISATRYDCPPVGLSLKENETPQQKQSYLPPQNLYTGGRGGGGKELTTCCHWKKYSASLRQEI